MFVSKDKEVFFVNSIINWYSKFRRNFPWRYENDPYRVLIAEIMLQRTRAKQVLPAYLEFLSRFPDIQSISRSEIDIIRATISSLGLERRTHTIKNMANFLLTYYGGVVPSDPTVLKNIPGIGQYISDAVGVFAFNMRTTVIDTNVVRIVTRYFGIPLVGKIRTRKNFVNFCQELSNYVSPNDIKAFNWGLLDLGATICTSSPKCKSCPLSNNCNYYSGK